MSVPAVSIVIPVRNAMPYLLKGLDSVLAQTIGVDRLEVIAIDDGSTDESGEVLDAFAAAHPGLVQVHHQEASGTPSVPRNRGLELARGEYVFFLDADDYLGVEALERMVAMAEANGSDIVLGRGAGHGGRGAPRSMFQEDQPRADLYSSRVYWTLGPCKLFRRSLLDDHKIRFPADRRTGEDQVFTFLAYFHARNISVVASYDCYHTVQRDDGGNLTSGGMTIPKDAHFNPQTTLELMLDLVGRTVPPGPGRDHLMKRHWEVEGVNELARLRQLRDPEQGRRFAKLRDLLERWYTPGTATTLAPGLRLAYHLAALGDLEGAMTANDRKDEIELVGRHGAVWAALPGRGAEAGPQPGPWVAVTDAVEPLNWLDGAAADGPLLRIVGTARLRPIPSERIELHLDFKQRRTGVVRRFDLDHADGKFTFTLDMRTSFGPKATAKGVWDVWITVSIGDYELTVPFGRRLGGPLRGTRPHARWRDRFGKVYAELRLPAGKGLELQLGRLEGPAAASLRRLGRRLVRALRGPGDGPRAR
jgi:CDP-glycerol glycerophosphotransferase